MIVEIPFTSDPAQSFVSQLGDTKYIIDARYNSRSGVWTFDITDEATSEVLVSNLAIVLGQRLLEAYDFFIGDFIAFDTSNTGQDAAADDLGTRVKVYWFSPDEVAE